MPHMSSWVKVVYTICIECYGQGCMYTMCVYVLYVTLVLFVMYQTDLITCIFKVYVN